MMKFIILNGNLSEKPKITKITIWYGNHHPFTTAKIKRCKITTCGDKSPHLVTLYDTKDKKTLYTYHTISPKLLKDVNLQNDRLDTNIPTILSTNNLQLDEQQQNFLEIKKAFDNQKNESKYRMTTQMLVPVDDMPFLAWKTTTFHYINIAPLWEDLVPLMNLINNRIRQLVIKSNKKLTIYTIAFKTALEEYEDELYLDQSRDFNIPNIWCKLVDSEKDNLATAIIIHNTPGHPPKRKELCARQVQCNISEWVETTESQNLTEQKIYLTEYAYCCEASRKILDFYPIKEEWSYYRTAFVNMDYQPST